MYDHILASSVGTVMFKPRLATTLENSKFCRVPNH
jgi:hypothetical protein